jgi:hypothetical protein
MRGTWKNAHTGRRPHSCRAKVSKQANVYCDVQTTKCVNDVMLRQEKQSYWMVMLPHIQPGLYYPNIENTGMNIFLLANWQHSSQTRHFAPRWK